MKKTLTAALVSSASMLVCASIVQAQENTRFSWGGEIELGFQSIFDSDVAANEIDDPYLIIEVEGEFVLTDSAAIFGGLTLEEITGPSSGISDLGLYFHELGMSFETGAATFKIGKFHPSFGAAWDETAGFFGGSLAEDYELTEMLGGRRL